MTQDVTPLLAQSRPMTNPFKGRTGLDRVVRATGYSLAGLKTAYIKFLPRTADDYATVAVSVALDMEDGRCRDARIAINSAGPTAIPSTARL